MDTHEVTENKSVYVYGFLLGIAHERLKMVDEKTGGLINSCLDGMLMAALTMEAYLNHLGPHLFPCWDSIERSLSSQAKLDLLLEKMKYRPDFGQQPYQTFSRMIRFRNSIAHGRTHKLVDHVARKSWLQGEFPEESLTDWEASISESNLRQFIKDMDAMIVDLWNHSGILDQNLAPWIKGQWSYHT